MPVTLSRKWKPVGSAVAVTAATLSAVLAITVIPAAAGEGRNNGAITVAVEPGRATSDVEGRMERQRPLVAAADIVQGEIRRRGYPQFAGLVLRESHVDLWWKGEVPAALDRIVDRASKTAPVLVRPAAYSISEMQSAARQIEVRWVGDRDELQAIKMQPDGSGLIVSVPEAATTNRRAALPDVGVAVTVIGEAPVTPMSRENDWAPWVGGSRIFNSNGGYSCSSGFGVRNPSTNAQYVMTAAHCADFGNRIQSGGGLFIGNVALRHTAHDLALVPTSGVLGMVYRGGPNSDLIHNVHGWGDTYVGEYLCQSGMQTARNVGAPTCDIVVSAFQAGSGGFVEARQLQGRTAGYPGDSGGPVYSSDGRGGIIAKGIISGGDNSARLVFQDFRTAVDDFKIVAVTS
jgi:hypothetical protein